MNIKETLIKFNNIKFYNYNTLKKLSKKTGKNTRQLLKGFENYEKIYDKMHSKFYGDTAKQEKFLNNLKRIFKA